MNVRKLIQHLSEFKGDAEVFVSENEEPGSRPKRITEALWGHLEMKPVCILIFVKDEEYEDAEVLDLEETRD